MNHYQHLPSKHSRSLILRMALLCVVALGACTAQGASPASTPAPAPAPASALAPAPASMPLSTLDEAGETPVPTGGITEALRNLLAPLRSSTATSEPRTVEIPTQPPAPTPTAALPSPPALADINPALAASLQQYVDSVAVGSPPTGIVMLINIPGQGRWVGAGGMSDIVLQTSVIPDDRFRIASVTKTFVATLVLMLAQEGRLSLDDTVEYWLPGLVPNGQNITLRQLLNHTSGLYDYLDGGFVDMFLTQPDRVWQPQEMVAYGMSHNPYFAPGTPGLWKYSNTNYIVLGMVIEKVTGSTLGQELRHRIFEPLGMRNTFLEDCEELSGDFVHGYIGGEDLTNLNLSFAWAAGAMVSNASDIATFADALFTGKLLSQPMLDEMLTCTTMGDAPGYPIYGLGVSRNVEALGIATMGALPTQTRFSEVWGHIGGLTGFKSVLGYMPDRGITVVVLVNQMTAQVVPVALDGLSIALNGTP